MYHNLIAVGRLSKDPDLRYSDKGVAVCQFSIAVDDGYGENKSTIWYRVSCFGKTAEAVNQYAKKGNVVVVEGRLSPDKATGSPRIWLSKETQEPKASYEVAASTVRFLPSGEKKQEQQEDVF